MEGFEKELLTCLEALWQKIQMVQEEERTATTRDFERRLKVSLENLQSRKVGRWGKGVPSPYYLDGQLTETSITGMALGELMPQDEWLSLTQRIGGLETTLRMLHRLSLTPSKKQATQPPRRRRWIHTREELATLRIEAELAVVIEHLHDFLTPDIDLSEQGKSLAFCLGILGRADSNLFMRRPSLRIFTRSGEEPYYLREQVFGDEGLGHLRKLLGGPNSGPPPEVLIQEGRALEEVLISRHRLLDGLRSIPSHQTKSLD